MLVLHVLLRFLVVLFEELELAFGVSQLALAVKSHCTTSYHSLRDIESVGREKLVDHKSEASSPDDMDIQKRQASAEQFFGLSILRKTSANQQHAVHIIWLNYIRQEAAVQNYTLCAGADGQIDHPADRLHLHAVQLRLAAKSLID